MPIEIASPDPSRITTFVAGDGGEVYRASSGRLISGVRATDVGNGLVRIADPVASLAIEDVIVERAYRVLEDTASAKGGSAGVVGLAIRRVQASGLRRGFARIRYDSHDGAIADVAAEGVITEGAEDLPVGIAFDDQARNFTIDRCRMNGFRWRRGAEQYWNGDGFSAERENSGLLFRRCEAWANSDAGFDLKATNSRLDDCIAGRNARNFRLWSSISLGRVTSVAPNKIGGIGDTNHFSLLGPKTGEPNLVTIEHLVIRADQGWPVFDVYDGPVRVVVGSHDIQAPPGTPLVRLRSGGSVPGGIVWQSGAPAL
jgi:hypothetical protein